MSWVAVVSYGLVGLSYGSAAVIMLAIRSNREGAALLVGAIAASSAWAIATATLAANDRLILPAAVGLDAAHLVIWTAFLSRWMRVPRIGRGLAAASAVIGCWAVFGAWRPGLFIWTVYPSLVVVSLLGVLCVEQLLRSAEDDELKALRLTVLATGCLIVVDLLMYSQAALTGAPHPLAWIGRALVNFAVLPALVMVGRERELVVSRHVVFRAASILGGVSYLVVLGLAADVVRRVGGDWYSAVGLQFLVVALGLLILALYSGMVRRRVKIFLVKHFYRNKHDYRHEWLRLTDGLSRSGELVPLASSGLEALAQIVGARRGDLWMTRDGANFEWMASLGAPTTQRTFDRDHAIAIFLKARRWVIDSEEYAKAPDRYEMAFGDPAAGVLPQDTIIVPLDCHGVLQGFVRLEKRDRASSLNFEDHDILKTAGKQVAIALAQAQAQEKLAETRQFEAMNKMATFLMHDLKNILSQQQLLVANAVRFRHRPEFFDEAVATLRAGGERMKRVIDQIEHRSDSRGTNRADLCKVLIEVRSNCANRLPIPEVECPYPALWVQMPRDKLVSVLTHLIRNAQDATPPDGSVRLAVRRSGNELACAISDDGRGMDPEFIRDRLFRPFDTTKGAEGMGIGAHQARDLVRAAGGEIDVESTPAKGTTFRVRLPVVA